MKGFQSFFVSILVLSLTSISLLYANEPFRLEEIVVSATKMPEERADIPNAIIIKDEQDIKHSGAKTVGELLANELGIDWQTYGNYGGAPEEIHIRGMRGDATQVFINGINVNSPSLGVADVGMIPIENIEKIEVIKGSGSLLYGSGAMGGTVNIFTKRPKKDKTALAINTGYGTEDTYRLSVQHGMFLFKDFGYYITVGRSETDGFRDNSNLRQNDMSLKLLVDKGDQMEISLYGDYIDRKFGLPGAKPPDGTIPFSIGGIEFYNSDSASLLDHGRERDGHATFEIKGKPDGRFGYALKGFYTHMETYTYARYASTGGTGDETKVINVVAGADGHVALYPLDGAMLLLGGEYKDFEWRNDNYALNTTGIRTTKTRDTANITTKGIFTEGEYRPSRYIKGIAGIRHEDHSAFGGVNLPLFGMVINPTDKMVFKINHGRHFKAPTLNDLYWPQGLYESGNPDLKPEIGWHSDITYEHSLFKDKVFLSLSYFNWEISKKIQWEPDTNGVWKPMNLDDYTADGFEAGIRIGPFKNLTLSMNYTYTDAYEKSREYTRQDYGWPPFIPPDFRYTIVKRRATMVPESQFKGEARYKTDFGLTAVATARFVGKKAVYMTESTTYPATKTARYTMSPYWTVDARLEQRISKNWLISLDCKNLFDRDYDTHLMNFYDSTGKGYISGYPGAGRSFFLNVSWEY